MGISDDNDDKKNDKNKQSVGGAKLDNELEENATTVDISSENQGVDEVNDDFDSEKQGIEEVNEETKLNDISDESSIEDSNSQKSGISITTESQSPNDTYEITENTESLQQETNTSNPQPSSGISLTTNPSKNPNPPTNPISDTNPDIKPESKPDGEEPKPDDEGSEDEKPSIKTKEKKDAPDKFKFDPMDFKGDGSWSGLLISSLHYFNLLTTTGTIDANRYKKWKKQQGFSNFDVFLDMYGSQKTNAIPREIKRDVEALGAYKKLAGLNQYLKETPVEKISEDLNIKVGNVIDGADKIVDGIMDGPVGPKVISDSLDKLAGTYNSYLGNQELEKPFRAVDADLNKISENYSNIRDNNVLISNLEDDNKKMKEYVQVLNKEIDEISESELSEGNRKIQDEKIAELNKLSVKIDKNKEECQKLQEENNKIDVDLKGNLKNLEKHQAEFDNKKAELGAKYKNNEDLNTNIDAKENFLRNRHDVVNKQNVDVESDPAASTTGAASEPVTHTTGVESEPAALKTGVELEPPASTTDAEPPVSAAGVEPEIADLKTGVESEPPASTTDAEPPVSAAGAEPEIADLKTEVEPVVPAAVQTDIAPDTADSTTGAESEPSVSKPEFTGQLESKENSMSELADNGGVVNTDGTPHNSSLSDNTQTAFNMLKENDLSLLENIENSAENKSEANLKDNIGATVTNEDEGVKKIKNK